MTTVRKDKYMLNKKDNNSLELDEQISRVLSRMQYLEPDSEEYGSTLLRLDKLYSMKNSNSSNNRISADTMLIVGANLLGIILILGYERAHVVTSKALGFVVKSKI
jgi:hypothetical protein